MSKELIHELPVSKQLRFWPVLETVRADIPTLWKEAKAQIQYNREVLLALPSASLWPSVCVSVWSWQHWGWDLGLYMC